eukprot:Tamp_31172.p1 GENE.Tamp_31172~~Tamp_31172.p1  ORF type:complete len:147 (+),score=7.75 Tamp_31172:191-631(+)
MKAVQDRLSRATKRHDTLRRRVESTLVRWRGRAVLYEAWDSWVAQVRLPLGEGQSHGDVTDSSSNGLDSSGDAPPSPPDSDENPGTPPTPQRDSRLLPPLPPMPHWDDEGEEDESENDEERLGVRDVRPPPPPPRRRSPNTSEAEA